jgi:hypothetical protein
MLFICIYSINNIREPMFAASLNLVGLKDNESVERKTKQPEQRVSQKTFGRVARGTYKHANS